MKTTTRENEPENKTKQKNPNECEQFFSIAILFVRQPL